MARGTRKQTKEPILGTAIRGMAILKINIKIKIIYSHNQYTKV